MKNIIISGAGEVGCYAAQVAKKRGMRVTIIETSRAAIEKVENSIEARIIAGSACHADILSLAEIENCDVLMAATSLDEVNLLTASIGKKMGAKTVMARIHNTAYFSSIFDYRTSFFVDHFICPEQLTAKIIASDLTEPETSHIPRFAQNEIEIRSLEVGRRSQAANLELRDLRLPPGVRIALIRRGCRSLAPEAGTRLLTGDQIALVGPGEGVKNVMPVFGKGSHRIRNLAILGAGAISEWLLNKLDLQKYQVKLFEPDVAAAEEIAAKFSNITVINEDPVEADVFAGEHLENCSAFLALGKNQEHNILGAMQAKSNGVPGVFALVQSSGFLRILKHTGIDHLYSPRVEAARALLQVTDTAPIKLLARLDPKASLVYQVKVKDHARAVGTVLSGLKFPKNAFIAAIERGGHVFCPVYKDRIEKGDILTAIGPRGVRDYLQSAFIDRGK